MPDLGHDMDDLLRKAAEHYPLSTGMSNWNAVATQLIEPVSLATRKNKKKKHGITFLFLLLFLFTSDIFTHRQSGEIERSAMFPDSEVTIRDNDAVVIDRVRVSFKNARPKRAASTTNTTDQQDAPAGNRNAFLPENSLRLVRVMHHESSPAKKINQVAKTEADVEILTTAKKTVSDRLAQSTIPGDFTRHKRGVYLGIVSGPEFSEVKNQGLKKSGFDIGLIAGYQFNRRLSAETGIFFTRKYYFSDGSHFNMQMPGMKVLSLDGSCTVLEMPLKIRYNVFDKKNMTIFSSVGLSSYLLTSEKNDYVTLVNGTEQSMVGFYKKPCRYFAATVDVSIGYEHTLGTATRLRIEPYMQIPLKGIGVGAMPVKSTGLHIGLLRSIR